MRNLGIAVLLTSMLAGLATCDASIITADQDAFVFDRAPSDALNYGGDTLLLGKFDDGDDWNRKAYIRFDLTSLTIPNSDYALLLNVVASGLGSTPSTRVYEFEIYGLPHEDVGGGTLDDWDEGTGTLAAPTTDGITWNSSVNYLNDITSGTAMQDGAISLGTFTITGTGAGETIRFSTPALANFLESIPTDDDGYVTFVLARNTPAGSNNYVHGFASKEHAGVAGPQLASIPEPATAIIWAVFGILGIAFTRRSWK